jgi:hypothetical protein
MNTFFVFILISVGICLAINSKLQECAKEVFQVHFRVFKGNDDEVQIQHIFKGAYFSTILWVISQKFKIYICSHECKKQ